MAAASGIEATRDRIESLPHMTARFMNMIEMDSIDHVLEEYEKRCGKVSIDERSVIVECPTCKKVGKVRVMEEIVLETVDHLYEYPVTGGQICDHSFLVKIDGNLKARS